jgi:hypothetical protein
MSARRGVDGLLGEGRKGPAPKRVAMFFESDMIQQLLNEIVEGK